MKKKITIVVDILMFVILLAQMLYVFAGNVVHEILGITFTVLRMLVPCLAEELRGVAIFGETLFQIFNGSHNF